ncbi:MAG: winged helix-turn-helix domain-containing protein, partial [Acidimicrobiaceae bacterium]|nr:winged helix-turn-helix domain-containing protein [Acidimicrobiaceae bacterium]
LGRRELLEKSNDRRWAVWYLVDRPTDSPRADTNCLPLVFDQTGDFEQPKNLLVRHDLASIKLPLSPRLKQVLEILSDGPMSSSEIAEYLQVSRVAVHNLLRKLEDRGLVVPTEAERRSPHQRWTRTGK